MLQRLQFCCMTQIAVELCWGPRAGAGARRGEADARAESQTSPFAEGVWQDGGQVYDVHPRGQGADRESGEQLRERARQDAERG